MREYEIKVELGTMYYTLEAYGNGQMMRIDCPKCGVSYDTNLDPIEGEGK